jgi:tetratricopeptide (TPR) repeat protein
MQQGKMEMAVDNFNQCLKIDKKSIFANLDFAIIYYLKGNLKESKKYLNIAKSIEPRLSKGIDGVIELEKEGYYWTDKDKETLKKMFVELK